MCYEIPLVISLAVVYNILCFTNINMVYSLQQLTFAYNSIVKLAYSLQSAYIGLQFSVTLAYRIQTTLAYNSFFYFSQCMVRTCLGVGFIKQLLTGNIMPVYKNMNLPYRIQITLAYISFLYILYIILCTHCVSTIPALKVQGHTLVEQTCLIRKSLASGVLI